MQQWSRLVRPALPGVKWREEDAFIQNEGVAVDFDVVDSPGALDTHGRFTISGPKGCCAAALLFHGDHAVQARLQNGTHAMHASSLHLKHLLALPSANSIGADVGDPPEFYGRGDGSRTRYPVAPRARKACST